MASLTSRKLQELSQLPESTFARLWNTVKKHLQDEPNNSIGLAGPGCSPSEKNTRFLSWTIDYLDSGIGQQFWGHGADGKLNLTENSAVVLDLFKRLVTLVAMIERGRRKRIYKATHSREDEESEAEGEDEDDEDDEGDYIDDIQYQSSIQTVAGPSRQSSPTRVRAFGDRTQASPKRIKLSTSTDTGPRPSSSELLSPTPEPEEDGRIFKTRLGDNNIITPIFVPLTIDFKGFVEYCREGWGVENREMDAENVKVKVSISGLGQYQIGLGRSRGKGWSYIMKLAESMPESEIMVDL